MSPRLLPSAFFPGSVYSARWAARSRLAQFHFFGLSLGSLCCFPVFVPRSRDDLPWRVFLENRHRSDGFTGPRQAYPQRKARHDQPFHAEKTPRIRDSQQTGRGAIGALSGGPRGPLAAEVWLGFSAPITAEIYGPWVKNAKTYAVHKRPCLDRGISLGGAKFPAQPDFPPRPISPNGNSRPLTERSFKAAFRARDVFLRDLGGPSP